MDCFGVLVTLCNNLSILRIQRHFTESFIIYVHLQFIHLLKRVSLKRVCIYVIYEEEKLCRCIVYNTT